MEGRYNSLHAAFDQVRQLLDEGGVTPAPLQRPFPLWLGHSLPAGARWAGRRGAGLLSIKRPAVSAYLEGLKDGGHDPATARLGGGTEIVVADDPERAWATVAPHYRYQLNSYLAAAGRPPLAEADLGDRQANGRRPGALINIVVLTPDEAVASVRGRIDGLPAEHIYTWATIAGMPEDLAARHRELWLGPVRQALTASSPP
jgi:alkanesulfonate monooxygenase SsuD/methylene tetrahydromethanopterin reductase-like flavin-dependent oxidoreductase (luciferase family)